MPQSILAEGEERTLRPGARTPSRRLALASLSFAILLSSLATSIANVALPSLAEAFAASFQQVQWVVLAYLLAITILVVGVGRIGDVVGRRRLLLAGIMLFTIASAACGVAPSLPLLIAVRAVQGLGAAIMMALGMALVGETVAKEKTGSAMGLLGTMSAIGTALGPSLGGLLLAAFDWRAIFLVNVPLGLLAFLLARRSLAADLPNTGRTGFDLPGTLLLGLALAAYALAMTTRGDFGLVNFALVAGALAAAALFVFAERKAASPLIQLEMFRHRLLGAGLAMNALVSTVMMATLVVGPFYLSRALGLEDSIVGMVMSAGPIIAAVSGVPAGRLVDRFGAPLIVSLGLAAIAAGAFGLSLLPGLFGVAGYIAAIAVLTPGYQLFQAANSTVVMIDVQPGQRGVVSGMLNLSRNLGLVTGASVMGAIFAFASAAPDIATAPADAVATGMKATFAVAGVLIAGALVIALWSRAPARASRRREVIR